MRIKKSTLKRIIREEIKRPAQDLSQPIPIDDLQFVDEEGYGAMMFPGEGFSYSVRENEFEAKKLSSRKGTEMML